MAFVLDDTIGVEEVFGQSQTGRIVGGIGRGWTLEEQIEMELVTFQCETRNVAAESGRNRFQPAAPSQNILHTIRSSQTPAAASNQKRPIDERLSLQVIAGHNSYPVRTRATPAPVQPIWRPSLRDACTAVSYSPFLGACIVRRWGCHDARDLRRRSWPRLQQMPGSKMSGIAAAAIMQESVRRASSRHGHPAPGSSR